MHRIFDRIYRWVRDPRFFPEFILNISVPVSLSTLIPPKLAHQAACGTTRTSTRRFCWRPLAVSLPATGLDSPYPIAVIR